MITILDHFQENGTRVPLLLVEILSDAKCIIALNLMILRPLLWSTDLQKISKVKLVFIWLFLVTFFVKTTPQIGFYFLKFYVMVKPRNPFIWHSPRESILHPVEILSDAKCKIALNLMILRPLLWLTDLQKMSKVKFVFIWLFWWLGSFRRKEGNTYWERLITSVGKQYFTWK